MTEHFHAESLVLAVEDGVALLQVNRPAALNALNSMVLQELQTTFLYLAGFEAVQVIVLTGAGEKAFVAGADIAEMADMTVSQALDFARKGQQLVKTMGALPKPIIAAVNGYALGGGLELALASDFIYCSEKARIGFPEVGLGIIPGFGGTQKLARLIGRNRANEMIFTGRMLTAEEALRWGVANAVFPAERLLDAALNTARQIAGNGLVGIGRAKEAIARGGIMSEEDGLNYESILFASLFSTEDQKEGMRAFLEKRKPLFRQR